MTREDLTAKCVTSQRLVLPDFEESAECGGGTTAEPPVTTTQDPAATTTSEDIIVTPPSGGCGGSPISRAPFISELCQWWRYGDIYGKLESPLLDLKINQWHKIVDSQNGLSPGFTFPGYRSAFQMGLGITYGAQVSVNNWCALAGNYPITGISTRLHYDYNSFPAGGVPTAYEWLDFNAVFQNAGFPNGCQWFLPTMRLEFVKFIAGPGGGLGIPGGTRVSGHAIGTNIEISGTIEPFDITIRGNLEEPPLGLQPGPYPIPPNNVFQTQWFPDAFYSTITGCPVNVLTGSFKIKISTNPD